ncbi:MAG: alpha/beta hydrolase [Actinomycetota bacterium]
MRMTMAMLAAVLACNVASAQQPAEIEDRLVTVPLSRGSELNLVVSRRIDTHPSIAVLLFAGYPGVLRIREENGNIAYDLRGNFLMRARRHLINDAISTVMVDCPRDQWRSCDDVYRSSDQHAHDVGEVIAKVKQDYGFQKVYVMGTSYGTVSSSFLALKLGDSLTGAIHTATFTDPAVSRNKGQGLALWNFDWKSIKMDQLFVHHKDDACTLTRYGSILARKGAIPLITVRGSRDSRGDVCEAYSAHGFVGREAATMGAIADWITTRTLTDTVGEDAADG